MKLHSTMNQQEWDDLLDYLTSQGALITYFAKTDNNNMFMGYKYALVEYKNRFYYMENPLNMFEPFQVIRYIKVSPYEKHQNAFPVQVSSAEELMAYMNEEDTASPLKKTYVQWIFGELRQMHNRHTKLWYLRNELAGWREKNILSNLKSISKIQNTKDYCLLRFYSDDGDYFDYETNSCRITG